MHVTTYWALALAPQAWTARLVPHLELFTASPCQPAVALVHVLLAEFWTWATGLLLVRRVNCADIGANAFSGVDTIGCQRSVSWNRARISVGSCHGIIKMSLITLL